MSDKTPSDRMRSSQELKKSVEAAFVAGESRSQITEKLLKEGRSYDETKVLIDSYIYSPEFRSINLFPSILACLYGLIFIGTGAIAYSNLAPSLLRYFLSFVLFAGGLHLVVMGATRHHHNIRATRMLVENTDALVTAFIVALVIKSFCIEVFRIPSSSMEPTLMGDQKDVDSQTGEERVILSGDKIMVTKFTYLFRDVQRYDVIVFRFPLQQSKHFIKRVVGLPDEEIIIHQGDIYTRKRTSTDQRFMLARKPLTIQDAVWINPSVQDDFLANKEIFEKHWPVSIPGSRFEWRDSALILDRSSESGFEYRHDIEDKQQHPMDVHDALLALTLTPEDGDGTFTASIKNMYGTFTASLSAADPCALYINVPGQMPVRFPFKSGPLKKGISYSLELAVYDGIAIAKLNGRIEAQKEFLSSYEPNRALTTSKTRLSIAARNISCTVRTLRIGRDIHYVSGDNIAEDRPLTIPGDSYFVIGDHVEQSHDSRKWIRHEVKLKNGRSIVCESIAYKSDDSSLPRHGYKYIVTEDQYGMLYRFNEEDIVPGSHRTAPAPFVPERFIMGRAFWVWFPAGVEPHRPGTWENFRNLRLIR